MNNLQALKALVAFPVSGEVFEKALLDLDLLPTDPYTKHNKTNIDAAAVAVLRHVKQLKQFSEGDLSISVSESAIDSLIAELTGLPENPQPTIRSISNLW